MAEKAYRLLHDTSLPRPIRTATTTDGVEIEETTGQAYGAGDYVFESELTSETRERVENGEYETVLEDADYDEAVEARTARERGLFIPEHEVERYAMLDAGHRIIERDQVLELRAAGAEAAREYVEAARENTPEEEQVTQQPSFIEVPALTEVSDPTNDTLNVPIGGDGRQEPVSDKELVESRGASDNVEMPPGLPVGPTLAKAEGADAEEVDQEVERSEKKSTRKRPGSSDSGSSSE